MVSMGKLGAGQAKYYLDQAELPISTASAASSGVEDYYAGGPHRQRRPREHEKPR
jgi:hypothetical protein